MVSRQVERSLRTQFACQPFIRNYSRVSSFIHGLLYYLLFIDNYHPTDSIKVRIFLFFSVTHNDVING